MAEKECFPRPLMIITLLLIMTELVYFSVSQKVTCEIPTVEIGQVMALTCDYGVDLRNPSDHGDIYIRRKTKLSPDERLVDCFWKSDDEGYECKVYNSRVCFKNDISHHVSMYLPNVTKDDEGKYLCEITGRPTEPCTFNLEEPTPKPVTTPMPQTTTHPPPRPTVWKTIAIVFIVVAVILLLVVIMQNVTLVIFFDTVVEKLAFLSKKERSSNNSAIPAECQPFLNTVNPVKETEHTSPTPGMGPAGEKPPQKDVEAGAGTVVAQGAQNKRMSQDNKDGKASQDAKDGNEPAPKATETGGKDSVHTESEIKGGGDEK